jgi:uncharacterized protein (UPF0276 family)
VRIIVRQFVWEQLRRGMRRRMWRLRIMTATDDRFGIGWRPELALGILANLDRIDVVEVVADDFFGATKSERGSLATLAAQVPITLHGVSLGMASANSVDRVRLDKMSRLVNELSPIFWSEHLAFVRGGGLEIGHLAAPPRTADTVYGTLANLERARIATGSAPLVENIATLIDPPASDMDEAAWVSQVIGGSGSDLLLDLHNLYANSVNFGFDAVDYIDRLPAERIRAIHIAGGRWIGRPGEKRLLDDHLHRVPELVYDLLDCVSARAPHPLTVVLERDGDYPSIDVLLSELDRAREALESGRQKRSGAAHG